MYSIDPHSGSEAHISEGEENTYTEFIINLTKAGVQATVVPLVTTSEMAAKHWQGKIGLLWIDASHKYEDVKRDFLSWEQHLSPGAIVALHDCNKLGPAKVVRECFDHANDFTIIQSVDTIVAAKHMNAHWGELKDTTAGTT